MATVAIAFGLVRLVFTPYNYSQVRMPPPFAVMLAESIRTFLGQACWFYRPLYRLHDPAATRLVSRFLSWSRRRQATKSDRLPHHGVSHANCTVRSRPA